MCVQSSAADSPESDASGKKERKKDGNEQRTWGGKLLKKREKKRGENRVEEKNTK